MVSEYFGQFAAFAKGSFSERLVHTLVPEVTVEKAEQKAFSDAMPVACIYAWREYVLPKKMQRLLKRLLLKKWQHQLKWRLGFWPYLRDEIARICRSGISLKSMQTSQPTRSTVSRHILRNILNSQLTLF